MNPSDEPVFRHSQSQPLAEAPPLGIGDEPFRDALAMLLERIETLPDEERRQLQGVANATRHRHEQLRQTVGRLQETLDTLRVSIKYLMFDVEATRRENEYLRRVLGQDAPEQPD